MKQTLRTKRTEQKYQEHKKNWKDNYCALCSIEPLAENDFFKVVENDFPWDRIAKEHRMVVSKEHRPKLNAQELIVFDEYKDSLLVEWDALIENSSHMKSIYNHWHVHLIKYKEIKE